VVAIWCREPLQPRRLLFEAGVLAPSSTPPLSSRSAGDRAPGREQHTRGAAVVAAKDDERVVGNDPPDLGIQVGDHGGIGVPMFIPGRIFVGAMSCLGA
jgi:hypothetical protein